jgi:hypothetical protein
MKGHISIGVMHYFAPMEITIITALNYTYFVINSVGVPRVSGKEFHVTLPRGFRTDKAVRSIPAEALQLASRFEFHYTPNTAGGVTWRRLSWVSAIDNGKRYLRYLGWGYSGLVTRLNWVSYR